MSNWQASPASNPFVAIGAFLNGPASDWFNDRAELREYYNERQRELGGKPVTSVGLNGTAQRRAASRQQARKDMIDRAFPAPEDPYRQERAANQPAMDRPRRPRPSASPSVPSARAQRRRPT